MTAFLASSYFRSIISSANERALMVETASPARCGARESALAQLFLQNKTKGSGPSSKPTRLRTAQSEATVERARR